MTRFDFTWALKDMGVDCNSQTGYYEMANFAEIIVLESAIEAGAFNPETGDPQKFLRYMGREHFIEEFDLYADQLQEMADRYLNKEVNA